MNSNSMTVKSERTPVLKWRDYLRAALRTYMVQNSFNYGTYLGHGFAYILYPAFKKMYNNDKDKIKEALMANAEWYNTNLQMMPIITSLYLVMLDSGESLEDCRSIKMALMGPVGGIADSMFQFGLAPIFSSIGAALAMDGLVIGPILFFLAMNACILFNKIFVGYLSWNVGKSVISKLKEEMDEIKRVAFIVGVTVISGLVVKFTKIHLGLQYAAKMPNGKENIIKLETILDKIAPKMLPAGLCIIVYILLRKYNLSMYKLLAIIFALGMIGSLTGIFV